MKEMRAWQTIKAGDVKEFKKYYRFLCKTNSMEDTYLRLLDNPETLRVMQSKLPFKMREKWTRNVVQRREMGESELKFSDFVELVRIECQVLGDPIYSIQPETTERSKTKHDGGKKRFGGSRDTIFASNVLEDQELPWQEVCLYCLEKHDIDTCQKFL